MPLFTHGTKKIKRKKSSPISALKKLFHRKSSPQTYGEDEHITMGRKFAVMFGRSIFVLFLELVWFLLAPEFFLNVLTRFNLYNQWLINYHTNAVDVYTFWQLIPMIFMFTFGIFWSSGLLDMLFHNEPLKSVF